MFHDIDNEYLPKTTRRKAAKGTPVFFLIRQSQRSMLMGKRPSFHQGILGLRPAGYP